MNHKKTISPKNLLMLRVLIIDDEESARFVVRHIVQEHCPLVEVVGEADGVGSGLEAIHASAPDLVLLDIQLKDGTAFDLLSALDVVGFKVIFVTAFERYAIDAIRFSALRYFLKPVDPLELAQALNQLATTLPAESMSLKLNAFITNLLPDFAGRRKVVLEGDSGVFLVNLSDIIRCESLGLQTRLFLRNNEKIVINKSLRDYQEMFANEHFFKLSKDHLLNLKHFERFDETGASNIVTSDQCYVPFNPEKKKGLTEALRKM